MWRGPRTIKRGKIVHLGVPGVAQLGGKKKAIKISEKFSNGKDPKMGNQRREPEERATRGGENIG